MGEEYVCALRARLIVPPDSQDNFHRVVRIVATFFFFKMACNDLGMTVRCRWFFFSFPPTSLSPPLKNRIGHSKFQSYPFIYRDVNYSPSCFDF